MNTPTLDIEALYLEWVNNFLTAQLLAVRQEHACLTLHSDDGTEQLDDENFGIDDYDIHQIEFACVPLEVDNHQILVIPTEEVTEIK